MFELLTGLNPFSHARNKDDLRDKVNKQDFHLPKTLNLSLLSLGFLNSCLLLDKRARSTFEQLEQHPWLKIFTVFNNSEDLKDAEIAELAVLPGDNVPQAIVLDVQEEGHYSYRFDNLPESVKEMGDGSHNKFLDGINQLLNFPCKPPSGVYS